jgi:NAD(P)H-hydrate epimerase
MTPGVMTVGIGEGDYFEVGDVAALLERAERYDVLALGPGLGPKREAFVAAVTAGWEGRLVVDADGLNALPGAPALAARSGETILTPHPGEFRRIAGAEPGYLAASAYAADAGATVVLKGAPTFIAELDRWLVTSGGPELATIGTGDVLTGMIAALWARGLPAADAARSAAYWHGIAAQELARAETVTAERLAREVGRWAW